MPRPCAHRDHACLYFATQRDTEGAEAEGYILEGYCDSCDTILSYNQCLEIAKKRNKGLCPAGDPITGGPADVIRDRLSRYLGLKDLDPLIKHFEALKLQKAVKTP